MKLTVAASPHIKGNFFVDRIMLDVIIALIPALAVGTFILGARALLVAAVSVLSAVAFEALWCLITKRRVTVADGSAAVTGLLLSLTLPVSVPLWQVVVGDFFAIIIIKALFGGLGQNIFNPALAARAFLMLIYPLGITRYPVLDGVSSATPLHQMVMQTTPKESLLDMFLGNCSGSIGEISALALLIGGVYLYVRKVISPRIPLAYLGSLFVLSLIFHKTDNTLIWSAYNLLSGGAMLGAVFMATDYVTSPITHKGQILFGIGCGALTLVFRYFGLFPEGVTYAILLMNLAVWVIDRYTAFPRFGTKGGGKK